MTGLEAATAATARAGGEAVTDVVEHGRLLMRTVEIAATITEVLRTTMRRLKEMHVQGAAPAVDHDLATERVIANLEARCQATAISNRAQFADSPTAIEGMCHA